MPLFLCPRRLISLMHVLSCNMPPEAFCSIYSDLRAARCSRPPPPAPAPAAIDGSSLGAMQRTQRGKSKATFPSYPPPEGKVW
jgi:hypothetical protein